MVYSKCKEGERGGGRRGRGGREGRRRGRVKGEECKWIMNVNKFCALDKFLIGVIHFSSFCAVFKIRRDNHISWGAWI